MPRKRPGETLTEKQRTFCNEYVIDLNATNAAIRAGYSEDSARSTAAHLLADGHVSDYIGLLQEEKFLRLRITADQVLMELARIGFADVEDFVVRGSTTPACAETASADRLTMTKGEEEDSTTGNNYEDIEVNGITQRIFKSKETHSMVRRAAMSYRRVVVDPVTGDRTTYTFSLHHKIMALRILGQHLGVFVPKPDSGVEKTIVVRPRWLNIPWKDEGEPI
jgi:hypothetical protein